MGRASALATGSDCTFTGLPAFIAAVKLGHISDSTACMSHTCCVHHSLSIQLALVSLMTQMGQDHKSSRFMFWQSQRNLRWSSYVVWGVGWQWSCQRAALPLQQEWLWHLVPPPACPSAPAPPEQQHPVLPGPIDHCSWVGRKGQGKTASNQKLDCGKA